MFSRWLRWMDGKNKDEELLGMSMAVKPEHLCHKLHTGRATVKP